MAIAARMKRYAFLMHRWTGVAMCILMALWFVSGIVMLFVGYPKLTPSERLRPLPELSARACCVSPTAALARSRAAAAVKEVVLTPIAGRPHYVLHEGDGSHTLVDAADGSLAAPADGARALESARAFLPGAAAEYLGSMDEDRWTHSRALNIHRPLHLVQMHDPASTLLYLSSSTGQVVLDAPRAERLWNFAGAWLHWLYMLRDRPSDPVWSWTLIAVSAVGVITAVTGVLNGIWRWRFKGAYKNGTRTPFRETCMRWHHILGLVFGAILCTWIFSGLMSMNPAGIFDARGPRPDQASYEGGSPAASRLPLDIPDLLSLLRREGFHASELQWRVLGGRPFVLARDAGGATRVVRDVGGAYAVLERWPDAELIQAAAGLMPFPMRDVALLQEYDAYYFKRGAASMYGGDQRRLPALRIAYDDPGQTMVHIDLHTGQMEQSMDRRQRVGRWLFRFLHSWDLPFMLQAGWMREVALVLLSLGGFALSATSVLIAARRLKKWLASNRPVRIGAKPLPGREPAA